MWYILGRDLCTVNNMILNRAYVKIENNSFRNAINEMLKETFDDVDIDWENKIGKITTINEHSFQISLFKILSLAMQDLNIKIAILIVPFFDDLFEKYLPYSENKVATLFEVFTKSINEKQTQDDIKKIYNRFSKKDIDTIRAFLACNGNSKLAASELFLHRNSFTYRLNQFIDRTTIDIRDMNSMMFLNLVISYCS